MFYLFAAFGAVFFLLAAYVFQLSRQIDRLDRALAQSAADQTSDASQGVSSGQEG